MITNSNPRALARGFFLSLSLLAAALLPGCRFGASDEAHRLGHVAPRSGPNETAGRRLGEAVALVAEEANADDAGKIEKRPVMFIHGDTGSEPAGFAFQATRLMAINGVEALVGAVNQSELSHLAAAVQAQSTPVVVVTPSAGIVGRSPDIVWPVGLHPTERGKYLARYAIDALKLSAVAILIDQSDPVFAAVRAGFDTEFRHADRNTAHEWFLPDSKGLADITPKVAAAAPNALLFCGRAADLHKLRPVLPAGCLVLFGGEDEEPALRSDTGAAGIIHVTAFTAKDGGERVQKFVTDFRNRTSHAPEAADALSADAVRVLLAAARQSKAFRKEDLVKELLKVEIDLPTGPFWYTKSGEVRRTAYVVRIKRGETELLQSYLPEKK